MFVYLVVITVHSLQADRAVPLCLILRDAEMDGEQRITLLAARSLEVNYRVGHYSITCVTKTVWSVVYSGGLQGRPSSSDMVPASSVLFTHMRDGGEPSLMACFSWSCRNTKHSRKSSPCPNLSACLIKRHKKGNRCVCEYVCIYKVSLLLQSENRH